MTPPKAHRDLHLTTPLTKGEDVKAVQRATNAIGKDKGYWWHVKVDGAYGSHTNRCAHYAAFSTGLPRRKLKQIERGVLSVETQQLLRDPSKRTAAQKARASARASRVRKQIEKHHNVRKALVANAKWGAANEPQIHYRQSRPIDGLGTRHKLPLYTDCSGFATDCAKWAGAPDPNGSGFNGYGFTGTILQHCRHVSRSTAEPGDYVVFGSYPGTHVVILVEPGNKADPLCVSHGQEAGPIQVPLSVESRAHSGQPLTFCSAT